MTDKEKNNNDFDLFQNDLFGSSESKNSSAKESPKPAPETPESPRSTSPAPTEPVLDSPGPQFTTAEKAELSQVNKEPIEPLGNEAGTMPEESQTNIKDKPEEPDANSGLKETRPQADIENSDPKSKETEISRNRVESPVHMEENRKVNESHHTTKMKKSIFRKKEKVVDTAHFGIILSTARENSGLDIDYIASETKIKKSYITALENEAYDKLPQKVYIRAYIRKLGHLYGLPDSQIEEINSTLMQDSGLLDEEVYSALVSLPEEDDDDLNGRVRSLPAVVIPLFGLIVLLGLLIFGGWLMFSYFSNKPKTSSEDGKTTFDSAKLEKFEPDQLIKMGEMPLPD